MKNGGSRTSESNRIIYCKTGSVIQQFLDEEEIKYIADDISPVIKKVIQQEKYIMIQADDEGVGMHEKAYSLDGVNWFSNNSLAVEKSGYYTVYVRDMLDNIAVEENVVVKIGDVTAPAIKDIQVNGFNIKIIAEDSESGLAEKAYSIDNKTWESGNEIKVEKDGQYMVYVRDKEGNVAKKLVVIETKEENNNNLDSKNDNENDNKNENKTTPDTNLEGDKTVTPVKKLPQTGENLLILIILITVASIVTISYKKIKNIKLK